MQTINEKWKAKMNENVQLGCLLSKWPKLFVDFSSATVSIFYHVSVQHEISTTRGPDSPKELKKLKFVPPAIFHLSSLKGLNLKLEVLVLPFSSA